MYNARNGLKILVFGLCLWLGALISSQPLSAQANPIKKESVICLQADKAGQPTYSTAVVVLTGEQDCQVLTTYEAVQGASRLTAVAAGYNPVPAKILRFAPEANLALLEVPIPKLPAVRLGDAQLLKNDTPLVLTWGVPVLSGSVMTSFEMTSRKGTFLDLLNRPTGPVARVRMEQPTPDNTSGALVYAPSSGELVGISLSFEASVRNHFMRFMIPVFLASALSSNLNTSSDAVVNIRVLDGAQAPVAAGGAPPEEGLTTTQGVMIVVGALVLVLGIAYFVLRPKKKPIVPFSVVPLFPESMEAAFVSADGQLLPMDKDVITIGRGQDNDWVIKDASVSGRHARLRRPRHGSTWELEDLGSTNGTIVRGRRMGRSDNVRPGDIIQFGHHYQVKFMTRAESVMLNSDSRPIIHG